MMTIYKYPFPIEDEFTISMPTGAKFLHVAVQGRQPCLWAQVDPARPCVDWQFRLHGTGGRPVEQPEQHVGTFQMPPFVWHLYFVPLTGH